MFSFAQCRTGPVPTKSLILYTGQCPHWYILGDVSQGKAEEYILYEGKAPDVLPRISDSKDILSTEKLLSAKRGQNWIEGIRDLSASSYRWILFSISKGKENLDVFELYHSPCWILLPDPLLKILEYKSTKNKYEK